MVQDKPYLKGHKIFDIISQKFRQVSCQNGTSVQHGILEYTYVRVIAFMHEDTLRQEQYYCRVGLRHPPECIPVVKSQ
jgi:hypothetical protein